MIIKCFSSADFSPKRLVYKERIKNDEAIWGSSDGGHEASKTKPSVRTWLGRTKKEIESKVADTYKEKKSEITKFVEDQSKYTSWKKWNREFAEKLGGTDISSNAKVRAIQHMVFSRLGLIDDNGKPKDSRTVIDGKMGPYTMGALAVFARVKPKFKIPEGQKVLAQLIIKKKTKTVEASASKALKGMGEELLGGRVGQYGVELKDGSYLVQEGESKTLFKFKDGRWMWKSAEDKQWYEINSAQKEVNSRANKIATILANQATDIKKTPASPVKKSKETAAGIQYNNPYSKPVPLFSAAYNSSQLQEYYESPVGFEPSNGPFLPAGWAEKYWKTISEPKLEKTPKAKPQAPEKKPANALERDRQVAAWVGGELEPAAFNKLIGKLAGHKITKANVKAVLVGMLDMNDINHKQWAKLERKLV